MKKRLLSVILSLLFVCSLGFAGCGMNNKDYSGPINAKDEPEEEKEEVSETVTTDTNSDISTENEPIKEIITATLSLSSLIDDSAISDAKVIIESSTTSYEGNPNGDGTYIFSDIQPGEYVITCDNHWLLNNTLTVADKSIEEKISAIPYPASPTSAYAILFWDNGQDYDICLYNAINGECVRNYYTTDSDGNNLLFDDDGNKGYEIIEIADITDKNYRLYVIDPRNLLINEDSKLTSSINVGIYLGNGDKISVSPSESSRDSFWTPGYISGGAFVEDAYIVTDLLGNKWARVDKDNPPYTIDNLPDGYFIKDGDLFWPISTASDSYPDGFGESDTWDAGSCLYTAAEKYSDFSLPTLSLENTVFAAKGTSGYSNIRFSKREYWGYTYNCEFNSVGVAEFPNDFLETDGGVWPWEKDIRTFDGEEMTIEDFIAKKKAEGMSLKYNEQLLVGDRSFLGDTFTMGYFDKTEFKEKEFKITYWFASGNAYVGGELDWNETYDGYFEMRFPKQISNVFETIDVTPGLYVISFGNNDYYVWME